MLRMIGKEQRFYTKIYKMNIVAISYQPNCTNYIEAVLSYFPKTKKIFIKKEAYLNNKEAILLMIKKKIQNSNCFLISGTSATDNFEKKVRKLFYRLKLPVFIILDSTFNIKKRFIKNDYLKPGIFVNDKYSKTLLLQNKFLDKKIFNFGNIYLEKLLKKNNKPRDVNSKEILLISQPLSERNKNFNEISCFKILYNLSCKNNYSLSVKTHPRENINKWNKLYKKYNFNIISKKFNRVNLKKYKYIFGINTESFLECITQNKGTFALNFTRIYKDNYCIRNKLVRSIENQKKLNEIFLKTSTNNNAKSLIQKNVVGKKIFNQIKHETKKYF